MPCIDCRGSSVSDASRIPVELIFGEKQKRFDSLVATLEPLYTILTHRSSVVIQYLLFVLHTLLATAFFGFSVVYKFRPNHTENITSIVLQMLFFCFLLLSSTINVYCIQIYWYDKSDGKNSFDRMCTVLLDVGFTIPLNFLVCFSGT